MSLPLIRIITRPALGAEFFFFPDLRHGLCSRKRAAGHVKVGCARALTAANCVLAVSQRALLDSSAEQLAPRRRELTRGGVRRELQHAINHDSTLLEPETSAVQGRGGRCAGTRQAWAAGKCAAAPAPSLPSTCSDGAPTNH